MRYLLLLVYCLSLTLITSCGVQSSAGTDPTSLPLAARTTEAPTTPPESPIIQTSTPNPPTQQPTPSLAPTSATIPTSQTSETDRLSLATAWVWSRNQACAYGGGTLLGIAQDGVVQQLHVSVVDVVPGITPPLLLICSSEAGYSLLDTNTWQSTPITLRPDMQLLGSLASPNGRNIALIAQSRTDNTVNNVASLIYIVDRQTGDVRLATNQSMPDMIDTPVPIAWSGNNLYVHIQTSATSYFWRIDVTKPDQKPEDVLTIGETGPWAISPDGQFLVWTQFLGETKVRNLVTGQDTTIEPSAYLAFSPDGSRLVSIQAERTEQCCTVTIYAVGQDTITPLVQNISIDQPRGDDGTSPIGWDSTGQAFRLTTNAPGLANGRVTVWGRDGNLIGQTNLPTETQVIASVALFNTHDIAVIGRSGTTTITTTYFHLHIAQSIEPNQTLRIGLPNTSEQNSFYYIRYTP